MAEMPDMTDKGGLPGFTGGVSPVFARCEACRRIFGNKETGHSCPQCGTGAKTEPWPLPVGRRLFATVEEIFRRQDRELTVILTCDFLELLLEMFFRDLFVKQRRPHSWIHLTLKKNKSLDLRLTYLFKETLHVSFSSAIQETSFGGFARRWTMIRSAKYSFLHGDPADSDKNTAKEAYDLARDALILFAWLNNRYCV
jgi:hypothetical protein